MSKFIAAASSLSYNFVVGSATVCALTGVYLFRRLAQGPVCKSKAMLTGKTAIVTGANTGMGKQTALDFARRNARVIVAGRNEENGLKAVREIVRETKNTNVTFKKVDLASFASIHSFADTITKEEEQVDILVNNAGVFMLPERRSTDGVEMHLAVNYLGHFLLTNLLLETLKKAPSARIVNIAADIPTWINGLNFDDINSEKSYNRVMAVIQSKQALLLYTKSLSSRLKDTSVAVNSVHPGIVRNEFGRYRDYWYGYFQLALYPIILLLAKTPWRGAQSAICCAVSEDLEGVSGYHFVNCKQKSIPLPRKLQTEEAGKQLWEDSSVWISFASRTNTIAIPFFNNVYIVLATYNY